MVSHQLAPYRAQRLVHRGDLRQDVGAVSVVGDHPLEPPYLSLDAAQPLEVGVLDVRIDRDRLASAIPAPAGAALDGLMHLVSRFPETAAAEVSSTQR